MCGIVSAVQYFLPQCGLCEKFHNLFWDDGKAVFESGSPKPEARERLTKTNSSEIYLWVT
jgi:hypothetical protein